MTTQITVPAEAFPPALAYELALDVDDLDEILSRNQVTQERFRELLQQELFLRTVAQYKKVIADQGIGFKTKAKIQAEASLPVPYHIAHDDNIHPSVRLEAVKLMAIWADYDPRNHRDKSGAQGATFNLQINL